MASSGLMVLWFVVIVALIPVSLWLLKRSGLAAGALGGTAQIIKPVGQLNIGPGQRIVTVEVGSGDARAWLVLGVTGQSIQTLHTMPAQALPEGASLPEGAHPAFAALLRRTTSQAQGKENV
ncbi:FliO/MopB family protein [Aquabacterium sp.]|uniref:FliO/MopB family protein n=1 Tax=Aquabacterium sp. TaxID=1872578 RepID=UPI0035B12F29